MTDITAVDFYWRPGCGFCIALERRLAQAGVPLRKHDIWDDPEHAAFVRSVAGGNETVPTVRIGDVALVNPAPAEVLRSLEEQARGLVPGADGPG